MVKKNITMHTDAKLVRSEMNEYYGFNCTLKKRSAEVLSPNSSESDLIWTQHLYRSSQVKMRSLQWALIQNDQRSYKKGKLGCEDKHVKGEHHVNMKADVRVMHQQVRRSLAHLTSQERVKEHILPYSTNPQKEINSANT